MSEGGSGSNIEEEGASKTEDVVEVPTEVKLDDAVSKKFRAYTQKLGPSVTEDPQNLQNTRDRNIKALEEEE